MARNKYWHARCERWGAWRVGAKGAKVAPWARMRDGTPAYREDGELPELHLEERETADLIALLPADIAAFLTRIYPWQARITLRLGVNRQTFYERIDVAHRMLSRMQDQRRRGEPLDPMRRRPPVRSRRVRLQHGRGRRITVAATGDG